MARLKWDMPACPGIYCIEHVASGRSYIGSTRSLRKRLREHRLSLRKGKHFAPYLQRAFNKYGEDAFAFRALETCLDDPLMLIAREQVWMDRAKGKLFNTRSAADQFSSEWARSEEAKAFHREHGTKVSRSWLRRPAVEVECQECGRSFLSKAPEGFRAKYCSRNCSMKEEIRQGKRHTIRTCTYCGSEYRTDKYRETRFCSQRCKNRSESPVCESDIAPIISRAVSGESLTSIAASLSISPATVRRVVHREGWADVPLPPELEAALARYLSTDGPSPRSPGPIPPALPGRD